MSGPHILPAADGHLSIHLDDSSGAGLAVLSRFLREVHGFAHEGGLAGGMDALVGPNFTRGELFFTSGWDIWYGSYLHAEDDASDTFLREVEDELLRYVAEAFAQNP